MDERTTAFLAAARSCALSPMEHAQVRAAVAAHTMQMAPSALLRESSTSLSLSDYEKSIGRARLLNFMRKNPIDERGGTFIHRLFKPFVAALSSAAALTLIGGGLAYAAEGSLPGDLLYPVKVHITEPVISGLSFTSAGRAQWNIQTIERRLNESDALSQKPDPSGRQVILRSQMEENAANLGESLRGLSVEDRKTIRKNLVSKLAQRRESLLQIQGATGLPPALRIIVEDAADEPREADTGDDEDSISPSGAVERHDRQKPEQTTAGKRRQAIAPSPEEDEGQEMSSESSSVLNGASLSEDAETGNDGRLRGERRNAAQSLLRTLRENSSSLRSTLSISPSSEPFLGSPDEEMEKDE